MKSLLKVTNLTLVSLLVLTACSRNTDIPFEFPTPPLAGLATPIPKLELKRDAELEKHIALIASEAKGKVGVAAILLETGEAAFLNADERFPMQSIYKLPISMAVVDRVRLGNLDLEEKIGVTKEDMVRAGMRSPLRDKNPAGGEFTIRELIRLAIIESDGTASDVLMRVAGGAEEIQAVLNQIGITDLKVVNTEKEIGRDWETQYQNWATPIAAIELLRWLEAAVRTASDSDRVPTPASMEVNDLNELMKFLAHSVPGAMRLKRQLPPGTVVAHKTGTSGTQNGITAATNDIGIIEMPNGNHLAIAVFVSDSQADEKTRESVIAKISKAVFSKWEGPPNYLNGQPIRGEIDVDVNGIRLGSKYAEVLRGLGSPQKTVIGLFNECAEQNEMTMFYPGLKVELLGLGKRENYDVWSLDLTSGDWKVSGMKLGALKSEVLSRLGEPYGSDENRLTYVHLLNNGGITFDVKNDLLTQMTASYTLC